MNTRFAITSSLLGILLSNGSVYSQETPECQVSFTEELEVLNRSEKLWIPSVDASSDEDKPAPLFLLSGSLKVMASNPGVLVVTRSFRPQCSYSFQKFSNDLIDAELELFGVVLTIEPIDYDKESSDDSGGEWILPAEVYPVSDFQMNQKDEDRSIYETNWVISTPESRFLFRLKSLQELSSKALQEIFGSRAAFFKMSESIDLIRRDELELKSPADSFQVRDLLWERNENASDFEKFYYDDYWIERKGFGSFGRYYEEYTKPLRGGCELRIRIERGNRLFVDPDYYELRSRHWGYP